MSSLKENKMGTMPIGRRAGLDRELKDTTRLIVAQRIGTIRNADKIIVLDEGRMVGMGTHEELMQTCPIYQEIARSQLSQEELGATNLETRISITWIW